MNGNEIKIGMQIRVISDEGTKGMLISPEILSRRQVGKTGTIKGYVSGHGGDVWFVEQDDGIAAYCFTELAVAMQPSSSGLLTMLENFCRVGCLKFVGIKSNHPESLRDFQPARAGGKDKNYE